MPKHPCKKRTDEQHLCRYSDTLHAQQRIHRTEALQGVELWEKLGGVLQLHSSVNLKDQECQELRHRSSKIAWKKNFSGPHGQTMEINKFEKKKRLWLHDVSLTFNFLERQETGKHRRRQWGERGAHHLHLHPPLPRPNAHNRRSHTPHFGLESRSQSRSLRCGAGIDSLGSLPFLSWICVNRKPFGTRVS